MIFASVYYNNTFKITKSILSKTFILYFRIFGKVGVFDNTVYFLISVYLHELQIYHNLCRYRNTELKKKLSTTLKLTFNTL